MGPDPPVHSGGHHGKERHSADHSDPAGYKAYTDRLRGQRRLLFGRRTGPDSGGSAGQPGGRNRGQPDG